ncbi:MAG: zinc ribbon domain-containing protein [Caldisericales bacterium]|nr:zinc ribbon domain-containing protein [Caldisericales bacterium]
MNKIKLIWKFLVEWLIKPIITFFVPFIFLSLIPIIPSSIIKGDPIKGIISIPLWVWIAIIILSITVYWRIDRIQNKNRGFGAVTYQHDRISDPCRHEYEDSIWVYYMERFLDYSTRLVPEDNPYCKRCGTKLKQSKELFWGGYIWSCVGCGRKIKRRFTFEEAEENLKCILNGIDLPETEISNEE